MQYKVQIDKLNHQGQGITKIDNKITFISKTIPEDIIKVELTDIHSKYQEARLTEIITPSKSRVESKCKYYNLCGGCNISNLEYSKQLDFKKNNVINIFNKYNNLSINPEIVSSKNIYNYRNKISLKVINGVLGYNEEKSNKLIHIDKCLLVTDNINNIINIINKNIDLSNITNIIIRDINNNIMISFISTKDNLSIDILKPLSKSIYINDKCVYGEKSLIQSLSNYNFLISKDSFFQINIDQTINLYNQILEYSNPSKEDKVLDLYCGTGTIGIYLSKYSKEVLGIEINSSSIDNANNNKVLNNISNINFKLGDVSKVLDLNYKANIVIVDPPRSGLDKHTISILLELNPKRIIYVSCNPITLSRDINLLKDKYTLKDIKLFDMFPQTYHVETVCVLERK